MTNKVNLLISDDNRLFREGVKRILTSRKMEIVGEVRSLAQAIESLRTHQHEVNLLLCDPSANIGDEFKTMKEITEEFGDLKIVLLTNQTTQSWLDMAVHAGANGFLPKDISADALRYSLEIVLLGERIFPALRSLLEPKQRLAPVAVSYTNSTQSRQTPLSIRERQILGCLVDGLPNKTIARNLNMAEATVKVHLKALLRKINVQNRTQAAIWGMSNTPREPATRLVSDMVDHNDRMAVAGR